MKARYVWSLPAVAFVLALLLASTPVTAQIPPSVIVTTQLLDFQSGFVFLTTGDAFRVSPAVQIVDLKTGAVLKLPVAARRYARITFDGTGTATKLEISRTPLAAEGDLGSIKRFAVALTPTVANPDLSGNGQASAQDPCGGVVPGKSVPVTFDVEVPPGTLQSDDVYMTTDQSGWNARAYKLTRIDALRYRIQIPFLSGTVFEYLFDRGSSQSLERGENGLDAKPKLLCVSNATVQNIAHRVFHWGDEAINGSAIVPQAFPTPYNPAPFPGFPPPGPRPKPTSRPNAAR